MSTVPPSPSDNEQNPVQTNYLNLPKDDSISSLRRKAAEDVERMGDGWRIRWRINTQTLTMAMVESLVIGRALEGDTDIGLDLTPYGAYHYGVSRHHARLQLIDGYMQIEDNNSTNGTRVNGWLVTPKQFYRLHNGDEIEFGRLLTVINFEKPKR